MKFMTGIILLITIASAISEEETTTVAEHSYESCGEEALCQPLNSCEYLRIIDDRFVESTTKTKFFDSRRCSTSKGLILHCCSEPENYQLRQGEEIYIKPKHLITQSIINFPMCKDPRGLDGFCRPFFDCERLTDILYSSILPSMKQEYLRKSICARTIDNDALYCCVPPQQDPETTNTK